MYQFLSACLQSEYKTVKTFRETEQKKVLKIRHIESGRFFVCRLFAGEPEEYKRLLPVKSEFIPEIYEVSYDGRNVLVLEEYIDGDSLEELMEGVVFTEKETRKVAQDICKGLYVLHQKGIVHRDVKPSNVKIRVGSDQAVLLDFDSSRIMKENRNRDTVVLGTTGFAAPEQYGISQTDGRADIYALGVLMNMMLTGKHPSEQLAEGKLGRVVSKCTMVNPEKRYKNVLRLMEALGL